MPPLLAILVTQRYQRKKTQTFCTLEVSITTYGFASETIIHCSKCDFHVDANSKDVKEDYEGKSKFLKYGINYKAVLLM
jgi:hypothetical protein